MVVGVTGGSGSGKSSMVRELQASYGDRTVCVISQDDYYLPIDLQAKDDKGKVNFDLPTALDLKAFARDIQRLSNGESIERKEYVYNKKGRESRSKKLVPAPLIIAEGLFLLCDEEVKSLLDRCVFVESEAQKQLIRRIERDTLERGYSMSDVRYQWKHHVRPAYEKYILPYREECDLVIENSGSKQDMASEFIELMAIRYGLPLVSDQML